MNCRACGARLAMPFLDLGPQPSGPELVEPSSDLLEDGMMPLRVSGCGNCGLVQLSDPMSPQAGVGHGHATTVSATLADHERRWASELVALVGDGPGPFRVLDVSCGDGMLLRAMAAAGGGRILPLGFERDTSLAQAARRMDIPTRPGAFDLEGASGLSAEGWLADLIVASQALAHVDQPGALLDAIATVLAPRGRLAIETHHLLGVVRDGQFDAVNHAHSIYPSLSALRPLLGARGFMVTRARSIDVYGGSIRLEATGSTQSEATSDDKDVEGVGAILAAEDEAQLNSPAALAKVGQRAARVASELRSFLVARRAEGARVAGYGAPARGGILLNLAEVNASLLPFTVDRNPAKHGRALAGSRIPVLPPDALEAAPPDYLLVLPWTLLPEIQAQLAGLTSRGTRLVVAMPRLRVVDA